MIATFLGYLRSGRIRGLPLRLWIFGGLITLTVAATAAWPAMLHLLDRCLVGSIYVALVAFAFFYLMFSLFIPLLIGRKCASRVRVWSS